MMKIKHLYLHVPFCNHICSYCDFCHLIYNEKIAKKWLQRLAKEIATLKNLDLETIYIGGGTPSCLSVCELVNLFELLKPLNKHVIEYTVEINPESLDEEKVLIFKKYGVNRASIGLQTSNESLLKLLNRKHNFFDVLRSVELLKKYGINNISIDVMYSLPKQSIDDLKKTLDDVLSLKITHVSLYSLTIEENTLFKHKGFKPLDDEIEADMYEYIVKKLTENNFHQYEVANFSLKNFESKHNMGYWLYEDFIGLSLGASSKIGNVRYDNTRSINEYFIQEDIKKEILNLDKKDMMFENIMMNLRLSKGMNILDFNKKYQVDFLSYYSKEIEKVKNLISIEKNYVKVNNLALLNDVLVEFIK